MASSLKIGAVSIFERKLNSSNIRPTVKTVVIPSVAPKVEATLLPGSFNGSRRVVIRIPKPTEISSTNIRLVANSIEGGKRKNPYRNPTPSPSPPPPVDESFEFSSSNFRRNYNRNPTPSPSPSPSRQGFDESYVQVKKETKSPLGQDQLPVISYPRHGSTSAQSNDPYARSKKAMMKNVPLKNFDKNLNLDKQESEEPLSLTLEELELFAKSFKQKRIKLGFTQGDVGAAMGKMYGLEFSQTTVSRFEALNLSFKNMCRLKVWLENWLEDTQQAIQKGMFEKQLFQDEDDSNETGCGSKRRKRRTVIDGNFRKILEAVYETNNRPSIDSLFDLARDLNIDKEVWKHISYRF